MTDIAASDARTLIHRLISAGGWHGNDNVIFSGMPHMSQRLSGDDLIEMLTNLGIPIAEIRCSETAVTRADCPALFVDQSGECQAVLDARNDALLAISPGEDTAIWRARRKGRGTLVQIQEPQNARRSEKPASVGQILGIMRPILPWLCLASLMTNLMGLATPLLVMVIYDRVIPSASLSFLGALIIAVAVIALADFSFRHARTLAVAHIGRHVEKQLSLALFRKLMALPLSQLQKTNVDQQRFRQFESLREIFTGQVMTTLLDLPFTPIYLAFLFFLAPPAAFLILAAICVYLSAGLVNLSFQRRRETQAAEENERLRARTLDAVRHQKAIAGLGLGQVWRNRHADLAKRAENAARSMREAQSTNQSFAQSLMSFAGIGSIFYSAHAAMAGEMSFGALIAVIALVWKALGPVQSLYGSLPQLLAYRRNRLHADRVLHLPEEHSRGLRKAHQKSLKGQIALRGVTYRPDPSRPPLLSQVGLDIAPGETVVIYGSDAASRSALLDLICGLHQTTIGTVAIDGIDVRQIAVDDLRSSISYAIPGSGLFYGTILQNFRLAAPATDEDTARSALREIGMEQEVDTFPDGLDTRLTDAFKAGLPQGTLPALSLARTMARDTAIFLFDEPTAGLDTARRTAFRAWLMRLKGRRTVIVATPDRAFLTRADRIIYLDRGRIAVDDCGTAGLKKVNAMFAQSGDV